MAWADAGSGIDAQQVVPAFSLLNAYYSFRLADVPAETESACMDHLLNSIFSEDDEYNIKTI